MSLGNCCGSMGMSIPSLYILKIWSLTGTFIPKTNPMASRFKKSAIKSKTRFRRQHKKECFFLQAKNDNKSQNNLVTTYNPI